MHAVAKIRQAMKDLSLYTEGEINACQIFKTREGWQIQKFGELPWRAGANVAEVLRTLQEIVDVRQAD